MIVNSISNLNFKNNSNIANLRKATNLDDKSKEKQINTKTLFVTIGAMSAIGLATYAILQKRNGTKLAVETVDKFKKDVLNYEIKPPKISDITIDAETARNVSEGGFPLEVEYLKIMEDIRRDENTYRRYNEVISSLRDTAFQIDEQFHRICLQDTGFMEYAHPHIERAVRQKRYFSALGEKQTQYCAKDPLLYKTAREEALDIQTGYHILEFAQSGNESWLLNVLMQNYGNSINDNDAKFISECVGKLKPAGAVCHGHDSKLHAHELARVGKIFREAMNIQIQ